MKGEQERWEEAVRREKQQSSGFKTEQRGITANTAIASSSAKNIGGFSITDANKAHTSGRSWKD